MFEQVEKAGKDDPDLFVLLLPPTSHRAINSLQRGSTIVLQKSLKEGFGLTVAEALWKKKPVIGGNVEGIRLQVIDGQTGLLVSAVKETASQINFLMQNAEVVQELGNRGKQHVLQNFLITRHLREYLTVIAQLLFPENPMLREMPLVKSFQR
ncbi:MAG: glycosyltransferase [Verrucomicrobia bacterium]|nr:glycosyltransferase [Verrucomicrobiota bacterium]